MATTQITAAMPIVMPMTVSMLRILFLNNATSAERSSAEWSMVAPITGRTSSGWNYLQYRFARLKQDS
jgi:hypothetical protein